MQSLVKEGIALKLICQSEAARLLGVSRVTLLKWRRKNMAPECIKQGKRRYFTREMIESWIRARAGAS